MIPDAQLLERFAIQRDQEAFADLMRRHAGMVYGTCLRLLGGDTHAAEDSTQDCFLALSRQAHQVRGNLIGWLHTTAIRLSLRRRSVVKTTDEGLDTIPVAELDRDREDLLERLDQALNELPTDLHEILVLRFLEGMPQEAIAERLKCSRPTIHRRIEQGLTKLRQILAPDEACSTTLGVVLGAVLVEPPSHLLTNLGRLALTTPAAAPVAVTATVGLGTWLAIAATGVLTVGIAAKVLWPKAPVVTPSTVTAASVSATAPTVMQDVIVTPRGYDADAAFAELARKGGPRVAVLGRKPPLFVPVALRFKPVAGRELITAVAATRNLSITWARNNTIAVLYAGCAEAEIDRLRKDLTSSDASQRSDAAWRAGWLADPRVVSELVSVTSDSDPAVARQVASSLDRLSWQAVVALDERSHVLLENIILEKKYSSPQSISPWSTISAIPFLNRDKALALLQKASTDDAKRVRVFVAMALRSFDGDEAVVLLEKFLTDNLHALPMVERERLAVVLLEKLLTDNGDDTRAVVAQSLGNAGGEKALLLLEKLLADKSDPVRERATQSLGKVGGDRSLALIEKTIVHQDATIRRFGVQTLGNEKALILLEKTLTDPNTYVRGLAVQTLGTIGNEKALILLEKILTDPNTHVRGLAVQALGTIGNEKALILLEKALTDPNTWVRSDAVTALGNVDGNKVLTLLEKALTDPESIVRDSVGKSLVMRGEEKVLFLLEKALADSDASVRSGVLWALGFLIGDDKVLRLLEKALSDSDVNVRAYAAFTLYSSVGGEKARERLEETLSDTDANVRVNAVRALGYLGGDRIRILLEKMLSDHDAKVRMEVVLAMRWVDGDNIPLFAKTLVDPDANVRSRSAYELARIGGDKVRDLLANWLVNENSQEGVGYCLEFLSTQFAKDPIMMKAITDARIRLKWNEIPPTKSTPTKPAVPKSPSPPKTGVDDF
jgi:RNA polymerase sigma factor (sigma-70 family)